MRERWRHAAAGALLGLLALGAATAARAATAPDLPPTLAFDAGIEDAAGVRLLDDGVLVHGVGGVARFDAAGRPLWSVGDDLRYPQDVVFARDLGRVFVLGFSELFALDAADGRVLWQRRFVPESSAPGWAEMGVDVVAVPDERLGGLSIARSLERHPERPEVLWVATLGSVVALAAADGTLVDEFRPDFTVERFALRHGDAGPVLLVGAEHHQVLHLADGDETRVLLRPGQLARPASAYRFSPDAGHVLVGGRDWGVIVDVSTGRSMPLAGASGYDFEQGALAADVPRLFLRGLGNVVDIVDLDAGAVVGGLAGHVASLREIAVSPDGRRALTSAEDRLPRYWDVTAQRALARLAGHDVPVVDLDFRADRERAATLDGDGTVRVYELDAAGAEATAPPAAGPVLTAQRGHSGTAGAVAASPDGRLVASGEGGEIVVWDRRSGLALRRMVLPPEQTVAGLHFADADRLVGVDRGGFVRTFDVRTGAELRRRRIAATASALARSRDGRRLAAGAVFTPTITILDLASGEVVERVALEAGARDFGAVSALALSPDGTRLAVGGSDGRVVEYALDDPAHTATERFVEEGRVSRLDYSPDGALLAASGFGTLSWYATTDFSRVDRLGVGGNLLTRFEDDGSALIAVGGGGFDSDVVRVGLDPATGEADDVRVLGPVRAGAAAPTPDGAVVLSTNDGALAFQPLDEDADLVRIDDPGAPVEDLAFSADGERLSVASEGRLDVWSLVEGRPARSRAARVVYPFNTHGRIAPGGETVDVVDTRSLRRVPAGAGIDVVAWEHGLSGDGGYLTMALGRPGTQEVLVVVGRDVVLVDPADGTVARRFDVPEDPGGSDFADVITGARFTPDGDRVLLTAANGRAHLVDAGTGEVVRRFGSDERCLEWNADGSARWERPEEGFCDGVTLPTFTPDGATLGLVQRSGGTEQLLVLDVASGALLRRIESGEARVRALAFSPDGARLASAGDSGVVQLWDRATGAARAALRGHAERVEALAFSPDGALLASGGRDGVTRLWDVAAAASVAELLATDTGDWTVTGPDGRYDAGRPGSAEGLFWILPDEPLRPLPIELFFKDYYEPRLLPRRLAGERFPAVTPLASLNRDQPEVAVETVAVDPADPERLRVTLAVDYETDAADGAVDAVKLFRDGRLVARRERAALDAAGVAAGVQGRLVVDGVQQPSGGGPIEFSAYAFNEDGIKSRTARRRVDRPGAVPDRPRRAFVISVGVNRYENPAWNLFFAGNDARVVNRELGARLVADGFDEIVPVLLLADGLEGPVTAERADLEAVLVTLAGGEADPQRLATIEGAGALDAATPDDAVFVTFSGHGYAEGGRFHFFLHDIGPGTRRGVDEATLARTLDSDALSQLMLGIDAGSLAMIIDACNSAASVGAGGFRPGPMGSRGLGQMAWDKRMMILASSQAEAVAIESAQLRHGIMSYALLIEGLEARMADHDPEDGAIGFGEWARWGVRRVPELYAQIWEGTFDGARGVPLAGVVARGDDEDDDWDDWEEETPPPQQPSLFDFRTAGDREPELSAPAGEG